MAAASPTVTDLLASCRGGDRRAFQALFDLYRDRVYSIALHYSGDPTVALDISQDVFVKLYAKLDSFRGESRFETWLTRLVINRCIDERRRSSRLVAWEDGIGPHPAGEAPGSPHRAAERALRDGEIRAAVAALEPELRSVVVLRYTEGLSYEEMSDVLDCPPGTVASRLHRAHKELAARLDQWKGESGNV